MAQTADRDANRVLRERLADVHGRYTRLRSDLDDLQRRLATLRVSAESEDGLVRATVGPRGELAGLVLDRRVHRHLDAEQLAHTILATARRAAERSADEVQALLAGYLPPEAVTMRLLRDSDFGSLLRRPDGIAGDE